jgi:hypothetical protein
MTRSRSSSPRPASAARSLRARACSRLPASSVSTSTRCAVVVASVVAARSRSTPGQFSKWAIDVDRLRRCRPWGDTEDAYEQRRGLKPDRRLGCCAQVRDDVVRRRATREPGAPPGGSQEPRPQPTSCSTRRALCYLELPPSRAGRRRVDGGPRHRRTARRVRPNGHRPLARRSAGRCITRSVAATAPPPSRFAAPPSSPLWRGYVDRVVRRGRRHRQHHHRRPFVRPAHRRGPVVGGAHEPADPLRRRPDEPGLVRDDEPGRRPQPHRGRPGGAERTDRRAVPRCRGRHAGHGRRRARDRARRQPDHAPHRGRHRPHAARPGTVHVRHRRGHLRAGSAFELAGRHAQVYLAPCIAGHVGADTAAVILSEGPHRSPTMQLLVDVGTNAEIVVGDRTASSPPAAPPALRSRAPSSAAGSARPPVPSSGSASTADARRPRSR